MGKNSRNSQSAYSLVELLAVIAAIGVLSAIAFANYNSFRTRAFDAATEVEFRNLRHQMELLRVDEYAPTVVIFNQRGPQRLPVPFDALSLSRGMHITYVLHLRFDIFTGPVYLQIILLGHENGSHRKYYARFGNNVITAEFPPL